LLLQQDPQLPLLGLVAMPWAKAYLLQAVKQQQRLRPQRLLQQAQVAY
jgi:hypothetical protein